MSKSKIIMGNLVCLVILLVCLAVPLILNAQELQGTIIGLDGDTITVETEIVADLGPVAGDSVVVFKSLGEGVLEIAIGTWTVREVRGIRFTADPAGPPRQPPEPGMKVLVMLSRGKNFKSGPDVFVPGESASTPRGTVTMMRGSNVTIALDPAASSVVPVPGDRLKLLFTVAGEPITVGTWQVSAVRDNGTVEADPVNIIQQPSIGYQAIFLSREAVPEPGTTEPAAEHAEQPGPATGDTEVKIAEPEVEVQKVKRRETGVTRDFSSLKPESSCDIGTVRVAAGRIEMSAGKAEARRHCLFPIVDDPLEDFRASVDLQVDGKNFVAGFFYGDPDAEASETLLVYLATQTLSSSSGSLWKREKNEMAFAWLGGAYQNKKENVHSGRENFWDSFDGANGVNPTPGTLELSREGTQCTLSWNGKEIISWEETVIARGMIGIMFKPISDKQGKAVFSNISVKRLD